MNSPPVTSVGRLVRHVVHGRNPLARSSDRVQGGVLIVVVALALLAIPVVATVGSVVYANRAADAVEHARSSHETEAVLLADAPDTAGYFTADIAPVAGVQAAWQLSDGTTEQGEITVLAGSLKGSRTTIWVDESGAMTTPPLTESDAASLGVLVAMLMWLFGVMLLVVGYVLLRWALDRKRYRQWQDDWARIEPTWTGR